MDDSPATANTPATETTPAPAQRSISMHDNIPDWYDCCTCEAEPYWIEAFAAEKEEEKGKAD